MNDAQPTWTPTLEEFTRHQTTPSWVYTGELTGAIAHIRAVCDNIDEHPEEAGYLVVTTRVRPDGTRERTSTFADSEEDAWRAHVAHFTDVLPFPDEAAPGEHAQSLADRLADARTNGTVSVQVAARVLQVHPARIFQLMEHGELAFVVSGGYQRVLVPSLGEYAGGRASARVMDAAVTAVVAPDLYQRRVDLTG